MPNEMPSQPLFATTGRANNFMGEASEIVNSAATAIWARELDLCQIAAASGARLAEAVNGKGAGSPGIDAFMAAAQAEIDATVSDLRAITDLTWECELRLADLYARAWRGTFQIH